MTKNIRGEINVSTPRVAAPLEARPQICAALTIFLLLTVAAAPAGARTGGSDPDAAAIGSIKRTIATFDDGFKQQDPHLLAMTFTEDSDHTNMFGLHEHGRSEIEKRYTHLFSTTLKGAMRSDRFKDAHFYTPNLALVEAETVISGTKKEDGSVGPVRKGLMILIMQKQGGNWLIDNFHEAEYPTNRPAP